ncbi:translation initiation factor eIF-3, subunit D [Basidiobolus meristosporus CBS 931.73]|uniref:Eukaryotic translation initiation factor 3 subunit D n=1 Tax=Basidiobolus meristosporus CBS 931.73 TaxID=1314790 RepID=A0A1Y1XSF1_9FUNG|nr:translation initiation factor eIF-3, subunit D [Basidiobolus meristosporus CBS 931.73]|eukprot:ORX88426.1 translation initiation factor eIF-3, subunit D [Basidiobolus meristosporus CBS 931.73]
MTTRASFVLSTIHDNESGWGPSASHLPEEYKDIPYAPYSKGEKLGRIADWSAPDNKDNKDMGGRNRQGYRNYKESYQGYGSGAASAFVYQHTEDESSFSVVDNRTGAQKRSVRGTVSAKRPGRNQNQNQKTGQAQRTGFANRGGYNRTGYQKKPQRTRDASVTIGPDWKVVEEFELHRLAKLALPVRQPEDIASYGKLFHYEKSYDRIVSKNEKPLEEISRTRFNVTTSEDPVLQSLMAKNEGTVYATDNILALLMSAPRSAYPWDIIVTREGDNLIFDKRDGGVFDFLSVNENAAEPPVEGGDLNNPTALSYEATDINNNFSAQVLNEEESYDFENPNPFQSSQDTEPLASAGYRYRRFNLGDEEEPLNLIVRTEVDGYSKVGNTDAFVTIKALNEFDSRAPGSGGALDWRQKLDTQRGAIVATEMKNNGSKLARWALQAVLAGCEQLRLGYVSRAHPKENTRHVILGTQVFKPAEFAAQMNLSLQNAWGILKAMVDICLRLPEGKFILIKDPNRPMLRLYSVPQDAFEQDVTTKDESEKAPTHEAEH